MRRAVLVPLLLSALVAQAGVSNGPVGIPASGGTLTGPLQVGTATPVTVSPAGYVTLGNISTPAPALGRLYFDSTGGGAVYVSLDGVGFVPLSTGTANDMFSSVLSNANQFSGDGASVALTLKSSSVTLQGNSFNGASQLVQMTAAGNLPAAGVLSATSVAVGAGVAFSSAPIGHVSGASIVGALASGTTFLTFVPDSAITLKRLNADVVVAGIAGAGDTITCNNAAGTGISVSLSAAATAGTTATATGNANIAYQGQVFCHIESAAATRPVVSVTLEYVGQ